MKRKNEKWKLYKITIIGLFVLLGVFSTVAYINANAKVDYNGVLDVIADAVKEVKDTTIRTSNNNNLDESDYTVEVKPVVIENSETVEEPAEDVVEETFIEEDYSENEYEDTYVEEYVEETYEEPVEEETYVESTGYYSPEYLMNMGVVYDGGFRYTWYSERVLPGYGLNIPGRWSDGNFVRDENGYICVASEDFAKGTVLETPWGTAKVYDCGCAHGTIDLYTSW